MQFSRWKNILVVFVIAMVFIASIFFVLNKTQEVPATILPAETVASTVPQVPLPPQKLANPPEIIKAIYMTGNSAGRKAYLNYLTGLFKNTEINAVVVDIKGSGGYTTSNLDNLVRFFHDQNIYVIGRIAVFEDPVFSKAHPEWAIYNKQTKNLWKDNNGQGWMDPASKDVWDYNVSIAKDAFSHGFDEMNFDYIRFPSDGNMANIGYPIYDGKTTKSQVIKNFFAYLRKQMPDEKLSVDLFGQTTVNKDDMGIGQTIENAFNYFDFVSPMVYPSHYINGFIGYKNPAEHPYEVVKYSLDSGVLRQTAFVNSILQTTSTTIQPALFRPWLQDFNMGAFYNSDMVKQEIKAVQDALGDKYKGFMLWNPSNIYTQGAIATYKQ